jgi:hypothetical protein
MTMRKRTAVCFIAFALFAVPAALACPEKPLADLSRAEEFANDATLPLRFPLNGMNQLRTNNIAMFCTAGGYGLGPSGEFHAAEDYHLPAGTSVYAMADGEISYSGPREGYGWLIIIDHPQANLYSLYGHLSPSRWRIRSGSVEKGDLIAYLGDSDENGGTAEHPMRTHLHFGIRAGQRQDYGSAGEWRWQAGWIKPCPTDAGWLQPSAIINAQRLPDGGFQLPAGSFFNRLGPELLFAGVYLLLGIGLLLYALKRKRLTQLFVGGILLFVASFVLLLRGMHFSWLPMGMAVLLLGIATWKLIRRPGRSSSP